MDNLRTTFVTLIDQPVPEVLFHRVMKRVVRPITVAFLIGSIGIIFLFIGSFWYFYEQLAALDFFTVLQFASSTLEFDIRSFVESISFIAGFVPPLAALIFITSCFGVGMLILSLLRLRRLSIMFPFTWVKL